MIKGVVHFSAELNLQALERSVDVLVERKISRLVGRCSARVTAFVAEGAQQRAAGALGG